MILILPVLIPFLVAVASLLAWQRLTLQRWLGVGGAAALLAASVALLARVRREGMQTMQVGDWPAPYGITLAADHFSALLLLVAAAVGLAVAVYSLVDLDRPRQSFAYYPLLHILLMGVSAALLTGDLFNLYVWFEVMLISSFVLLGLGSERSQLVGGLKYVTLNLVSSFLFLTAVGILYGAVGTLNLADASRKLAELDNPDLVTTLSSLFLIAFGVKAAVFPLYFWLPASYPAPPAAISALFAGLLTKVGVYALARVFTLLFTEEVTLTHALLLAVSGLTMVTGVLGAVAQNHLRRSLSFLLISHVGLMLLGLGLFTRQGLAGMTFYMVHHMLAIACLFLVAGLVHQLRRTYDVRELGGLYRERPGLALLFGIAGLSLAGIPPFSGFVGKLALLQAALEAGQWTLAAVTVAISLLTLYCVGRLWVGIFWKPVPKREAHEEETAGERRTGRLGRLEQSVLYGPTAVLAGLLVVVGVAAGPVYEWSDAAAHELLHQEGYVETVLGRAE